MPCERERIGTRAKNFCTHFFLRRPPLKRHARDVGHTLNGRQERRILGRLGQDLVELALPLLALGELGEVLVVLELALLGLGRGRPASDCSCFFLRGDGVGHVAVEEHEVGHGGEAGHDEPYAELC